MKKIQALMILIVLSMAILPLICENVDGGTQAIYSDADKDGYIRCTDSNYSKAINGTGSFFQSFNNTYIGVENSAFGPVPIYIIDRGYLSFETSTISDNVEILSARLNVRLYYIEIDSTDFNVEIENIEYGDLDTSDFNKTGTYEGILLNSAEGIVDTWYGLDISLSGLNTTGTTQYKMVSDTEGTIPTDTQLLSFYSGDHAGSEPYLSVIAETPSGATLSYNFTVGSGMSNRTVTTYPVEIIDWNNTHEIYRYEFWSFNQTSINWSINENFSYFSISPYASVTDFGSGILNITETYENCQYWIFFIKERDITLTTIHIALYSSSQLEGFHFVKYRTLINTGSGFNNSTATRVPNSDYKVTYGLTYTLSILPYEYDVVITNTTFVANSIDMDIEISVPVHSVTFFNQDVNFVECRLYYNKTGNPYNFFLNPSCDKEIIMPERDYMMVYQFYETFDNISYSPIEDEYYFNYTIDGAYNIMFNGDNIITVISRMDGLEQEFEQITAYITPDIVMIYQNMPDPITDYGTRSPSSEFIGTIPFRIHPYLVTEATVTQNFTGITSADLYSVLPSTGTVETFTDQLTILTNEPTQIMLNYTNGTNFMNVTESGIYDLTIFDDSENFTLWSNNSISIFRNIRFQQASEFFWDWYQTDQYLETSITLNNTTPYDWKNAFFVIGIPDSVDIDIDSAEIEDQDNDVLLNRTLHYQVDSNGFYMRFNSFTSGEARTFMPYFFTVEREIPSYVDAVIEILSYQRQWFEVIGDEVWYGSGKWINTESGPYQGEIWLVMKNLLGDIDYDSVYVTDAEGNMIDDYDILSAQKGGSTIRIRYDDVGIVNLDEARTYRVYFEYSSYELPEFPFGLFYLISIIALSVIGVVWLFASSEKKTPIALLFAIALIIVIIVGMIGWNLSPS